MGASTLVSKMRDQQLPDLVVDVRWDSQMTLLHPQCSTLQFHMTILLPVQAWLLYAASIDSPIDCWCGQVTCCL